MEPIQTHEEADFAVGGHIHRVPLFLQPLVDEAGDLFVVFHQKNTHGRSRCSSSADTEISPPSLRLSAKPEDARDTQVGQA